MSHDWRQEGSSKHKAGATARLISEVASLVEHGFCADAETASYPHRLMWQIQVATPQARAPKRSVNQARGRPRCAAPSSEKNSGLPGLSEGCDGDYVGGRKPKSRGMDAGKRSFGFGLDKPDTAPYSLGR